MHLKLALAFATLSFFSSPIEAQERTSRGGDSVQDACREEARRVIAPSRTSRLSIDQKREMRREYVRDCRKRAGAR